MTWYSWGYNDYAEPGRSGWVSGTTTPLLDAQPTSFPGGVDIAHLVVGNTEGVACSTSGDVYCWAYLPAGNTSLGQCRFGNQFTYPPNALNPPTKLNYAESVGAVEVAMTQQGTFWRRSDGTVWGVGYNQNGEFGTGEAATTYHGTPIQLTGLPAGVTHIFAKDDGLSTWAIDGSGRLWMAGNSANGEDGSALNHGNKLTHALVAGMPATTVTQVAFDYRTVYALLSDGTVWTWGRNPLTGTTPLLAPAALSGITGIQQIFVSDGPSTTFLLTTGNVLQGFGSDSGGMLCNGSWSGGSTGVGSYVQNDHKSLPPVTITIPGKTASKLFRGSSSTYAMFVLTTDGQVWGWGVRDNMWGNAPPAYATTVTTPVMPPYQVFPTSFPSGTTDGVIMAERALFVAGPAAAPAVGMVPSLLATIVG